MKTYIGDVLVVDDMRECADMLVDQLLGEGYDVRSAENGKLAIEAITARSPELVLLDIHMPVMNGFEVFKWMKGRQESRNIPVIFLSAYIEADVRLQGLRMGAVDYISKPCSREELLARVRIHLELHRSRILLQNQNDELVSINCELQRALDSIKILRGLVPICASCKNVRDDKGYWQAVEGYIAEHSEAKFSHGICPDCMNKLYPQFAAGETKTS